MIIKLALGENRVSPVHELSMSEDGFVQCERIQNFIVRDKKITKIGGTTAYNSSAASAAIPWVHRSYHKRADNTFTKVMFCFSDGVIYSGDDLTGTLTSRQAGFNVSALPLHATIQVSGNSILYFFSGEDEVCKYDGNGSYVWEKTTLCSDTGKTIIGAAVHLDRLWYWFKDSSSVIYSTTLLPENLTTDSDEIIIGQETDSVVKACIVGANETFYIFKSNSIWQLYGRTPSTFEFRKLTTKYGLATKRSVYPVGSGFIFLDSFTKELCFFGGSEASIYSLTEKNIRLRDILDVTQIEKCCMTVHKGLFRFSFKHVDDSIYQNRELIYALNEPGPDGLPKWSESRGARVYSYSVWAEQGDEQELVTGRSDTGKLMYHGRSNDFDGAAIETIIRTGEITASEDKVVRFKGFYIKGKPSAKDDTITFNYYVNARTSSPGTSNLPYKGETRTLGSIVISTQKLFNDRIIPYHASSLGNSISFELIDRNLGTDIEIYSIAFSAVERYKIRNALVG